MPTETVTVPLKLDDQFARNMADFLRIMRAVQEESGMRTRTRFQAFEEARDKFRRVGRDLKETFTPALRAFGITALSVTGAIAAVVRTVGQFSDSISRLSQSSRAAGIAADQMRTWQSVGERFRVGADQMAEGLVSFGDRVASFRKYAGDLNVALADQPEFQTFSNRLRATTTNIDAFRLAIKELMTIKRPDQRRRFLAMLGLPENLADMYGEDLQALIARIERRQGLLGKDWEARARATELAWLDLKDTWRNIVLMIGSELAPIFREASKALIEFTRTHRKEIQEAAQALAKWIMDPDGLANVVDKVKSAARIINDVAQWLGGWKNVILGILAIKTFTFFFNLAASILAVGQAIKQTVAFGYARSAFFGRVGAVVGGLFAGWDITSGMAAKENEEFYKQHPELRGTEPSAQDRAAIAAMPWYKRWSIWTQENIFGADPRQFIKKKDLVEGTTKGVLDALDQIKQEDKDRIKALAGAGAGGDGGDGHASTAAGARDSEDGAAASDGGGVLADSTVPAEIIAQAKKVALHSGPGGVEAFMRKAGYPKAGNWCGEFAAAVIKSVGGTPPRNPAIASNWRNWGVAVDDPQPGDVAIRRGVRTGALGSHVTFVESAGPNSFFGIGGNQGAWRRRLPLAGYTFRRSIARPPVAAPQPSPSVARVVVPGGGAGGTNLWVDLLGFPRGVVTSTQLGSGVNSVTLNRGRVAPQTQ